MRFSDPRQAIGHSSERQLAYARRWAQEHGLALDESLTLRDEGLSAYHQHHVRSGALGVFLAAVEEGKIASGSFLVVEGLDRLSRAEPIQAQAQLAQIVNAGISVVTASDGKVYSRERLKSNPMDLVYSLLVMIRAHEESDTKSKRVVASIRRQCQGWLDGTYRGLIRNGKDPVWVRRTDDAWELIPERVEAVHEGLRLYRIGYGATRIIEALQKKGLSLTGGGPQALQIYRLIRQRALLGEKELEVDGESFRMPGYYPALLNPAEWDDLQMLAGGRGRRKAAGPVPHILTGMGITICGYCGRAMVGQNIGTRRRDATGRIANGHRRLHCTSSSHGGCTVSGSTSVAPFERALLHYCSDLVNLQALYGQDRGAVPRAVLAKARGHLQEVEAKLQRLTDAMLEAEDEGVPLVFARKARELETEQRQLTEAIEAAERELAATVRADLTGVDQKWCELAERVEAQDVEARLQARQLVADTFERIIIYHRGIRPSEDNTGPMDMMLVAKGGHGRVLRLSRRGDLIDAEDVE
ncbi:recombinase family protein [Malikia sp.]|uniref:recombinase family protein n=1 Tax=Malikia sp. TaxID=2070706 RepID=UPI00260E54D7|nr:recombinase family protein [Malikia sp.]MDD2728345.1 recombinase family protein [Malikia sp.]